MLYDGTYMYLYMARVGRNFIFYAWEFFFHVQAIHWKLKHMFCVENENIHHHFNLIHCLKIVSFERCFFFCVELTYFFLAGFGVG